MSKNSRSGYGFGQGGPSPALYPFPVLARRAPLATDIDYEVGSTWIRPATNQVWILTSVVANNATWALSSPGATDVDTLTGDAGGPISPLLGDIVLAGGTNIGTTGAGNTITFDLDPAIVLATSVTAPLYTAAAADVLIQAGGVNDVVARLGDAAGATFFRVQDSTNADVFTIDSNGGVGAFLGLVVTGAFTQTAGAVNIGMDNLGSAINIGGGNVIKAMTIASGAAAHTLAIGSAAAGAMSIDTAAGISLNAATASNFTVTGAGADLGLITTGGSININATESAANAIIINASGAASGLNVDAGTDGITVDTTGAFSIDGAAASNITVTSAGFDLSLQGVGCAVNITSTQNENDAINIEASDAAGGVVISAGTGGIRIGDQVDCTGLTFGNIAPTATRNTNIATGTVVTAAVTDTINIGTGGATTNANSIKAVNINTGGVTLGEVNTNIATGAVTSGTHLTQIAIGNRAAGAMTLNMFTGTGTKIANLGNADAATTCNIDAITLINDSVNAATSINTGTSTGAVTIGNALAGTVTIDSVNVVEINSAGAAISIGNDADNFAANFGTAGVRTVTIGSNAGASATVIQSGSGKIDFAGVVMELTADFIDVSGDKLTFRQSPVLQSNANTGVAPTGATGDINIMALENGIIMEEYVIGAGQTIIAPRMDANGLLVSGDLTLSEGYEYGWDATRANSKHSFTIGTSAAFYLQWTFRAADVSGCEPAFVGFRKTQAYATVGIMNTYTDYVCIGLDNAVSTAKCITQTQLNTGGVVSVDSTDAWADGAVRTVRINVSAAGVVTFLYNGAPPSVTQAFTFDNGDVVHPMFRLEHGAGAPGAIDWVGCEIGFQ